MAYSSRFQAKSFTLIFTSLNGFLPRTVFQIPFDGFFHAAFKRLWRFPVKFLLKLGRINGVSEIMPGPVGNKLNLLTIAQLISSGPDAVKSVANHMHDFEIDRLRIAAQHVAIADCAAFKHSLQRTNSRCVRKCIVATP